MHAHTFSSRSSRSSRGSRGLLLLGALVLALPGCSTKQNEPKAKPAELEPVPEGHPPTEALPDPELSGGHVGRAPRRITVAQLKASIQVTTGRQWSQIDRLAASLGQADYALVNAEATEANLVFAKFLEDGAREVCLSAATADLEQPAADKRVLSPAVPASVKELNKIGDSSIDENLVYLSTRFWGQPLSEPELSTWRESFKKIATAAEAAKKRREGWGAMCIALMTDPRFLTY
jgi:hypothetical protein